MNGLKSKENQVISGNDDAAGPQLPRNAVSITQRMFGCDRLLGKRNWRCSFNIL